MTQGPSEATKDSGWKQFGTLGPAWITAIVGLLGVLTAAGFFAGKVTTSTTASPGPTVTVTVTATQAGAGDSGASAAPTSTAQNGAQLGTYSISMTAGISAPLGPSKPTQAQFNMNNNGDVGLGYNVDIIGPPQGTLDKLVLLPAGHAPTFQECSTSTAFAGSAPVVLGTSFCLIEPSGDLAGLTITSINQRIVTVQVTVWRFAS